MISVIRASLESLVHENDAGKQQRPVPEFHYKAVSCILRADRYGMARDFCSLPRSRVEARRKKTMEILRRGTAGDRKSGSAGMPGPDSDSGFSLKKKKNVWMY